MGVHAHLHRHEGCGCVASSGSCVAFPGPQLLHLHRRRLCPRLRLRLRQCAPCARMVFNKLLKFFVVSFELPRRVIRSIRPCARSSELHQHPLRLRVSWWPSLRIPQTTAPGGVAPDRPSCISILYMCECRGGLLYGSLRRRRLVVHPPLHVRYLQHWCVCVCHRPEAFLSVANLRMSRPSTPDCIEFRIYPLFDCLNASSSSSLVASPSRHRPHDASSARGFLCGCLPSTTSTAQHRPQLH
jgi:hypothetical protein